MSENTSARDQATRGDGDGEPHQQGNPQGNQAEEQGQPREEPRAAPLSDGDVRMVSVGDEDQSSEGSDGHGAPGPSQMGESVRKLAER